MADLTTSDDLHPGRIAEQAPPTARRSRRRRRPSGAPPPLPKQIGFTGKAWVIVLLVMLCWVVAGLLIDPVGRLTERADSSILRQIARIRTPWLTSTAKAIDGFGSGWAPSIVAVATMGLLVIFRRWRHLFTYLGVILVILFVGEQLYDGVARPRPYGVSVIGRWGGYSFPSPRSR